VVSRRLDFGTAAALEWDREAVESFPQQCISHKGPESPPSRQHAAGGPMRAHKGGCQMALVIGLVSMAVVWLIVIYGSNYVNKNVQ
jgi:hypothetical protein